MEEKRPDLISRYRFYLLGLVSLLTLLAGTVGYRIIEGFSWIDALYFSTITLTTIGYGDIAPQTDTGKIFTVFYVLVGISIVGAFINAIIRRAYSRQLAAKQSRVSKIFSHFRHPKDD